MRYLRFTSSGKAKKAFAFSSARWISSSGMPWSAMIANPYSSKLRPSFWAKLSGSRSASRSETDAILSALMVAMALRNKAKQQSRQRRAHQVGEAAGEQGANAELGDHRPLVGRKAAGHRHLDRDRAEVRKAAQSEGD